MYQTHAVEYYSAIKKNEIFSFVTTWMELDSIMLIEKEKYCIISLVESEKQNKWPNITKQTHVYREQTEYFQREGML